MQKTCPGNSRLDTLFGVDYLDTLCKTRPFVYEFFGVSRVIHFLKKENPVMDWTPLMLLCLLYPNIWIRIQGGGKWHFNEYIRGDRDLHRL